MISNFFIKEVKLFAIDSCLDKKVIAELLDTSNMNKYQKLIKLWCLL